MTLNIGILDDQTSWLKKAEKLIRTFAGEHDIEVGITTFTDLTSFTSYDGRPFDAVFIDIELDGEKTGIDAAKWMNSTHPDCSIIYLTNYSSYIMDAYSSSHMYYVIKSRLGEYIEDVFSKILAGKKLAETRITFRIIGDKDTYVSLALSEIMYFERNGRKTKIVTRFNEYETWEKIGEISERTDSRLFLRCHNSILVYMPAIKSLNRDVIVTEDGTELTVSRGYRSKVIDEFSEWAESHIVRRYEE